MSELVGKASFFFSDILFNTFVFGHFPCFNVLGSKCTPQQTRNIIRSNIENDSAEERLKDMLPALGNLTTAMLLSCRTNWD
jgi:hypothetical protein